MLHIDRLELSPAATLFAEKTVSDPNLRAQEVLQMHLDERRRAVDLLAEEIRKSGFQPGWIFALREGGVTPAIRLLVNHYQSNVRYSELETSIYGLNRVINTDFLKTPPRPRDASVLLIDDKPKTPEKTGLSAKVAVEFLLSFGTKEVGFGWFYDFEDPAKLNPGFMVIPQSIDPVRMPWER